MSSEPSLVDELWHSLVTSVIAAAAGLWCLLRHPWLLGAVLGRGRRDRGRRLDGRRPGPRHHCGRPGRPPIAATGHVCPHYLSTIAAGADRRAVSAGLGPNHGLVR